MRRLWTAKQVHKLIVEWPFVDEVWLEEVAHCGVSYPRPFLSPEASHSAMPKAKRNNQIQARSQ